VILSFDAFVALRLMFVTTDLAGVAEIASTISIELR